jgi:glycerol dehydrogenase
MVGARPTAAALSIAELGAKILFENGIKAVESVRKCEANEALENVIEANTLLSGIGFESGGLAASHGVAQVFPVIPFIEEKYMHGEMVALGVLVHRCLEGDVAEADRIATSFAQIGLPIHLGQISLDPEKHADELDTIIGKALSVPFLHYEPFEVTAEKLKQALMDAHTLGIRVSQQIGDEAYRCLHPDR